MKTVLGTKQILFLRWLSQGLDHHTIAAIENVAVAEVVDTLRSASTVLGTSSVERAIAAARQRHLF